MALPLFSSLKFKGFLPSAFCSKAIDWLILSIDLISFIGLLAVIPNDVSEIKNIIGAILLKKIVLSPYFAALYIFDYALKLLVIQGKLLSGCIKFRRVIYFSLSAPIRRIRATFPIFMGKEYNKLIMSEITSRSRKLRTNQTVAEKIIWNEIRAKN